MTDRCAYVIRATEGPCETCGHDASRHGEDPRGHGLVCFDCMAADTEAWDHPYVLPEVTT